MTEVLIRENFSETTHSVGNIYKKVDEGMWLLCNVLAWCIAILPAAFKVSFGG